MDNKPVFRGYVKSNKFRVTDQTQFLDLIDRTVHNTDNVIRATIHDNGMVSFYAESAIDNITMFTEGIRNLLAKDNICIFTEVLTEDDVMTGYVNIIENSLRARLGMDIIARNTVRELIGDSCWTENK